MALDALLEKYDLYYINPSSTKKGLMLASNKAGAKLWRREDERALPDSYAPGDISYANLSPDIQKTIAHRYLNGGLGALEFEVEDDADFQILRYLRSKNIDLRCKGKAYPGPKIVSLTLPDVTVPSITNPDMELTTGWLGDGARSSEQAYQGSYSWKQYPLGGSATKTSYQDMASFIRGATYTLKCYAYHAPDNAGSPGYSDIRLHDGTGESDSSNKTDASWSQLTVSRQLSLAATQLRLKLFTASEAPAYGCKGYFDHAELSSNVTLGATTADAVFNGKYYKNFGKLLARLNDAGTAFIAVGYFDHDITGLKTFPSNLFIALGAANKYYYMDTDEAFTQSSIAEGEADMFCKVGTDLWQLKWPNKIRKSTDPTNSGSWGSEITVGEATYNINDVQCHDDNLWCLKEEGPFYVESDGTVHQPFPKLETLLHDDAGKNSNVFGSGLYFRMGNQQEWEIKDSSLTQVTPELFAPGISQYAYPCVARASDESWLYAIIKRGSSDLAILAGRWEYIGGRTRFIWHEIRTIDLTDVATAFVCSVEGRPYLYLGSTDSSENVYKVYLPITNDATSDSGYRFHSGGSPTGQLWTPRYMTLLFVATKRWQELFMRSANFSATKYINAYYSTDDGGSFTLLKKFDTSPEQTEAFSDIEASMMNLRFDFVGDSDTTPPVLKYHSLKALTMMPSVARFNHTVKCADNLSLKKNLKPDSGYDASAIASFIDTIRDKVCTLGDREGNEHTVKVRIEADYEDIDPETQRPCRFYQIEAMKL